MLRINPKFYSLRTKIALLSFGSVFLAIMIGGFIVVERISSVLEKEIGMRAMAIARTLTQMEEIQHNVGKRDGSLRIQPIAERIRHATGVEYIVVVDMGAIRYSHPVEERIGKKFADQDIGPSLNNNEYISYAEGVLGPSVRAFVPIKVDEGTRQIGVVIVGILTPTVGSILRTIQLQLYYSLAMGLVVGLLGSLYLARRIKMAMFSMEPEEIARLLEERIAIFQAINEGVIAIDKMSRITVANDEARRIIAKEKEAIIGRPIREVIPDSPLPEVLETGQAQIHREMIVNNTVVLVNRVPVRFKGELIGAVSTFQDKTEVNRLAEELTGVRAFVEALRVQNHEHMNKLHTIAGLVQLEKYQQALDYVFETTEEQQEVTRLVTKNIADHQVAGLLLGKYSRAKELRAELSIDRNSRLKSLPPHLESSAMVVIIGNLIENALDAVRLQPADRRKIYFAMIERPEHLTITVRDNGPGIPPEHSNRVFEHGYSTKDPLSRGLGLYLVRRYVKLAGGTIVLNVPEGGGAEFNISIPIKTNQNNRTGEEMWEDDAD